MWTTTTTPLGRLRVVTDGAVVTALDFLDLDGTDLGESRSVRRSSARAPGPAQERADDDPLLREATEQATAYFRRDLKEFDLPLGPPGTPFQQRVWAALREIPYGEVTTYGTLAARLGMSGHAARAVGAANGANPIALVIPCHRVVGAGGKLIGYAGGMTKKQYLLALEQDALF
jgi:methylated-DNA-[protein]-cysteine S-methyltransferase